MDLPIPAGPWISAQARSPARSLAASPSAREAAFDLLVGVIVGHHLFAGTQVFGHARSVYLRRLIGRTTRLIVGR